MGLLARAAIKVDGLRFSRYCTFSPPEYTDNWANIIYDSLLGKNSASFHIYIPKQNAEN